MPDAQEDTRREVVYVAVQERIWYSRLMHIVVDERRVCAESEKFKRRQIPKNVAIDCVALSLSTFWINSVSNQEAPRERSITGLGQSRPKGGAG